MSIPLHTTKIDIRRSPDSADPNIDPTDAPASPYVLVVSGIRAVISTPSAQTTTSGGTRVVFNASMRCDPTDLQVNDEVTDSGGSVWRCLNVESEGAFALTFMIASLRKVTGTT